MIIKIWDDEEYDEVLFERQHASTELCDALYKHPSGWAMISAGSRALCPILIHRFIFLQQVISTESLRVADKRVSYLFYL